jgi:hypothetical protein
MNFGSPAKDMLFVPLREAKTIRMVMRAKIREIKALIQAATTEAVTD